MIGKNIILVTGAAGFIGSSLIYELLKSATTIVVGIDNINSYYDTALKYKNLNRIKNDRFVNYFIDISDVVEVNKIFNQWAFTEVYHLAAQAGVRYSINYPHDTIKTNILGFQNILDNVINYHIPKFIYASSSSVYGDTTEGEINNELNSCILQKSPYAVTKRSNELMASTYSLLYPDIKMTGLRFFNVYGPYMRPDLAISKFTKSILNNEELYIYGNGSQERDFTYIDDIVRIMITIMNSDKEWNHEIFNIGCGHPISVNNLIEIIKHYINPNFNKIIYQDNALGDVNKTLAVNDKIKEWFNEEPKYNINRGLSQYINWYKNKKENH